jgi:hypothetical protein
MSTNREVEGGFRTPPSGRLRRQENARLIAAGFKPVDQGERLLWVKGDGVCYGREAALQVVKRKQPGEGA